MQVSSIDRGPFDEGLDGVRDLNRIFGGRMPSIDQGYVSNSTG